MTYCVIRLSYWQVNWTAEQEVRIHGLARAVVFCSWTINLRPQDQIKLPSLLLNNFSRNEIRVCTILSVSEMINNINIIHSKYFFVSDWLSIPGLFQLTGYNKPDFEDPSINRKNIGRLTSRNNGFVQSSAEGAKMVAKFQHYDEQMAKILDDKDSKNIQRASHGSHLIFKAYLQDRNIQKPATAEEY